ncbi:MAG: ferrous iron transport protein A, partial [Nocardioidaceae bacterium]|nr:ferrous iron transport protein A [Nocardioidaceae bacterium]
DRDSAALRYLAGIGIRPGVSLEVGQRAPFGGPLWLRVDGKEEAVGDQLGTLIYGRSAAPAATTAGGESS